MAAYDWDDIVATVGHSLGFEGDRCGGAGSAELHPEHIHNYPGVHETLARLKEAGHVLMA